MILLAKSNRIDEAMDISKHFLTIDDPNLPVQESLFPYTVKKSFYFYYYYYHLIF
jgi:hypothetical protein